MRERERKLSSKLDQIISEEKSPQHEASVGSQDVAEIVSMVTGIPVEDLSVDEAARLLNLEKELGKKVVGQEEVLKGLAGVLRRSRVVFLFIPSLDRRDKGLDLFFQLK